MLSKDSAAGVVLAEYEYDGKGNRKALRYPQCGMKTSYQYNDGNHVTALENKRQGIVISAWEYSYDVDGNILTKINKAGSAPVTISYCYDRLGRLTEEDYSDWKRTLYTYDAYSNRMKMMVEGRTKDELVSVTSYEYGLNNRLEKETKKQGKTTETYRHRYDDNGNETFRIWEKTAPTPDYPGNVKLSGTYQKEAPTVYEWRHYDGFNQLIRINQDDKEITYQYRGDGLRHSTQVRKLTESQGKTNLYCWDGSNIVAEQTDDGKIKTYLRGINLIAREIERVVYYYIFNEHGDVIQLWSQSGTCKASYEYDAFGIERNLDQEAENPFRYCGEYTDLETNTIYLRNRYYTPETGRFSAEDSARNGLYYYAYCLNNPIYYIDPRGLAEVSLRDYAVMNGGSVSWNQKTGYATITYNRQTYSVKSTSLNRRDGRIYIDDSVLNNKFGWGTSSASSSKITGQSSSNKSSSTSSNSSSVKSEISVYGPQLPNVVYSLPKTGEPNSTGLDFNPDGSVKQGRTYGPDGRAVNDRDFNHGGTGHEFPHDHEWNWDKIPPRQPGVPVPKPQDNKDATKAVVGGAVAVGAGYIIYRGIRMLPSLAPPLWATIPANAICP